MLASVSAEIPGAQSISTYENRFSGALSQGDDNFALQETQFRTRGQKRNKKLVASIPDIADARVNAFGKPRALCAKEVVVKECVERPTISYQRRELLVASSTQ